MFTKKGETDKIDLQRLGLFILALLVMYFLYKALSEVFLRAFSPR